MAAVKRGNAGTRQRGNVTKPRLPEAEGPVAQALGRYRRVGLDTICFIYHLSKHPLYTAITAGLFTMIEAGRLAAVTSSLALIEILARPKQLGHQAAADNYKVVLSTFPHLELRRADIAITELAADLRVRYRVTTPEAIQLATAIVDGADAFIGNTEPLRAVKEIEVVLLEDLRASTAAQGRARPLEMPTRRRPRVTGEAGFSLLELVIVVAMAAAVLLVFVQGVRQASASFLVRKAANITIAEIRTAQAASMANGIDVAVEFYTSTGSSTPGGMVVWARNPTTGIWSQLRTVLPPEFPVSVQMPDGPTNFQDCPPSINASHDCVIFKPLGYAEDDGDVRLRAIGASSIQLNIVMDEPATGRVAVVRP